MFASSFPCAASYARSGNIDGVESTTYPRSNRMLVYLALMAGLFASVFGVIAFIGDERGSALAAGLVLLFFGAVIGSLHVTVPHRIEVTPETLRAVSVLRSKELCWSDLRSVSSPWHDVANARIFWRSASGKIVTGRSYYGLYLLLSELSERAPQAEIRNLC